MAFAPADAGRFGGLALPLRHMAVPAGAIPVVPTMDGNAAVFTLGANPAPSRNLYGGSAWIKPRAVTVRAR